MRSRDSSRLATVVCAIGVLVAGCTPTLPDEPADPARPVPAPTPGVPTPGAAGAGDPYYPFDGNGGYDALGYEVSFSYDPASRRFEGDTTVTLRATQDLSRFNLDLRGFDVRSVEVAGRQAEFAREGEFELVVTPAQQITAGATVSARVRYDGTPLAAAPGSLGDNGWQQSASGGAFVLGEPHSAAFWFPVNETPRDKAKFTVNARVPSDWQVMSIGREQPGPTADGWTTTTWIEDRPVASYLTTVAIDRFTIERGALSDGTPVIDAYAPGAEQRRESVGRVPEVIEFLSGRFGPYPQGSAGGIHLQADIGFSLETQGRPTYAQWADLETVVHELAHQWYGNSVSVQSWADICLNECLASYAQWLWSEGTTGENLDDRYRLAVDRFRADNGFWAPKLYDMGPGKEFDGVYDKGILAVHALRRQLGEQRFDRVLRGWADHNLGGNASWPEFETFVGEIAGEDLRGFFDAWFRGTVIPAEEYLYPAPPR
ncbi:peptidase [Amycolatopsis antarctica]|uniref:Aminopeptidase N n=1 Tax=Amycolatopsis antarctica TaxID=1854586 RepID=A0A263CXP1_9PSEU|nr:M1 family metallopeptidase [Amycolatopsis antarctica]OZM70913.1 peptidase [Amycolatopsis antarctica]